MMMTYSSGWPLLRIGGLSYVTEQNILLFIVDESVLLSDANPCNTSTINNSVPHECNSILCSYSLLGVFVLSSGNQCLEY